MPSAIVDARTITRRHGARTVLHRVSLRVDKSSRIGLVGPNGSGKSTLLRVLAGLEPPDSGEVAACARSAISPRSPTPTPTAPWPPATSCSNASGWRRPPARLSA
jgi:ATP-binding cassette subfamily F protein uup